MLKLRQQDFVDAEICVMDYKPARGSSRPIHRSSAKHAVYVQRKAACEWFWSLTVYGADEYLFPNSINAYALGDRSSLIYADGSLVYGSGKDGAFQMLIQPDGGHFTLNLRYYGPSGGILNGTYVEPVVTVQDAIVS